MPRYVAFLRGINLGRRRPPMSELKRLFEELGFSDVATFIASGNVIFATKAKDAGKLEGRIESHLAAELGYDVATFIRSAEEVKAVLSFPAFAGEVPEGGAVYVNFLKVPMEPTLITGLLACRTETDEFCVNGRDVYWLCRIRSSESEVWTSPAMKALKFPLATMRNMTSVRKLAAKHGIAV
jgi:uncharacterized protein (DUF1697 family)